jgi:hypothetical protein
MLLNALSATERKISRERQGEVKMTSLRLLAASMLAALYAPAVLAQAPAPAAPTAANPWFLGAPFPEASEEVLGATAGGKLYVFASLQRVPVIVVHSLHA